MRRQVPPFELTISALGPKGVGVGRSPDGHEVLVRGGVPGSTVRVVLTARKRGVWHARRLETLQPPPGAVAPRCAVFGQCGGCTLQELPLEVQRAHKHAYAIAEVGPVADGAVVHAMRGGEGAYGYRNKLELAFGPRRWLTDAEKSAGAHADGAFLGFHAPGRFDRVVDAQRCEIGSERSNAAIAVVRRHLAAPGSPPTWDPNRHDGWWRHLLLRDHDDGLMVVLFTGSQEHAEVVEAVRADLAADPAAHLRAFRWHVNPDVADVARGALVSAWGHEVLTQDLLGATFEVGPTSFFQTNTEATGVLYRTVSEAAGAGARLLDLYCGAGTIGQSLRDHFTTVLGVEENGEAVVEARRSAERNGVRGEYVAGRVEAVLDRVGCGPDDVVVVDPPRAGLHPKVAAHLAGLPAGTLVYVACNPASLRTDGQVLLAGGWRCTDVWTVDLFPQTGHVEVVARFTRCPA